MLNGSFNRAENFEKSAFLGSLTYALVREVDYVEANIFRFSDWYVVSRAHKLPCFAQS